MKSKLSGFVVLTVLAFLVALSLTGCASAGCSKPDWYLKGGGAFSGDKDVKLYGVGKVESDNIQSRQDIADDRARQDMAGQVQITVQKMITDYRNQATDPDMKEVAGTQEFSQIISKTLTNQILTGTTPVDRWECGNLGASLLVMDLNNSFFNSYKAQVKEAVRRQLKEKSDNALKDLDSAVAKQEQNDRQILGVTEPAPSIQETPVEQK